MNKKFKSFKTLLISLMICLSFSFLLNIFKNDEIKQDSQQVEQSTNAASGQWIDYRASGFASGDGSAGSPYIIKTAEHLAYFAYFNGSLTNKYVRIDATYIDLSAHYWSKGIGAVNGFSGYFDGGGCVINGLTINSFYELSFMNYYDDYDSYCNNYYHYGMGLFAAVENATIENLYLSNVNIVYSGYLQDDDDGYDYNYYEYYAGACVGYAYSSSIYDCGVTSGTIKINNSSGSITTADLSVGGILGRGEGSANRIYTSFNCAKIYAGYTSNIGASSYCGGLAGFLNGNINNCYCLGYIDNYLYYGGGLVGGFTGGSINCSYYRYNGTLWAASGYAGGLVGTMTSGSDIYFSYVCCSSINHNSTNLSNKYNGYLVGNIYGLSGNSATISYSAFYSSSGSGSHIGYTGSYVTTNANFIFTSVDSPKSLTFTCYSFWSFYDIDEEDIYESRTWDLYSGLNYGYPALYWSTYYTETDNGDLIGNVSIKDTCHSSTSFTNGYYIPGINVAFSVTRDSKYEIQWISYYRSSTVLSTSDSFSYVMQRADGNIKVIVTSITFTLYANKGSGSTTPTINGSTFSSTTRTYSKDSAMSLPTPARTGYIFNGWYTASSGGTKVSSTATATVNSTTTLYAQWTPITYTIRFNGNGGANSEGSTNYTRGTNTYDTSKALAANEFTRTGYSFAGWATSSSGSAVYSNGQSVLNLTSVNNSTVDLYAKWNPITYTTVFNGNYGTANNLPTSEISATSKTMSGVSVSYDSEKNILKLNGSSTGSITFGYFTPGVGKFVSGQTYTISSSLISGSASGDGCFVFELYGGSERNHCDFSYQSSESTTLTVNSTTASSGSYMAFWYWHYHGATFNNAEYYIKITTTQTVKKVTTYDENLGITISALKTGYSFKGWAEDFAKSVTFENGLGVGATGALESASNYYTNRTMLPFKNRSGKDVVLTSNYVVCGIYAYNSSGGFIKRCSNYSTTHTIPSNTCYIRIEINSGDLPYYARNNLSVIGSILDKDSSNNLSYISGDTVNLYAQWEANTYKIVYDANGGSGSMDSDRHTYGTTGSLSVCNFTNAGKIFLGWAFSKDGDVWYVDFNGQSINTVIAERHNYIPLNTDTITLYAKWGSSIAEKAETPTIVNGVYQITNYKHLAWVAYNVNVNKNSTFKAIQTAPIILSNEEWYPIGTLATPFSGEYNGNGYPIIGLTVTNKNNGVGLFGYINGGIVKNVYLTAISIDSNWDAGGIAGEVRGTANDPSIITNCIVEGTLQGNDDTAGLIGQFGSYSQLSNCIFKGSVSTNDDGYEASAFAYNIGDETTQTVENLYLETTNYLDWNYDGMYEGTFENILIKRGTSKVALKGEGDFSGWIMTANGTPLPPGFTWLEKGTTAVVIGLTEVNAWCSQ